MKKILLASLLSLFSTILLYSQEIQPFAVEISPNGRSVKFILKQDISTENVILSIDLEGNVEISTMGECEVEYHWLETMVSGKIEKIDNVKFEYYYDANNPGKLKKIGKLLFTYYDFHEHESKIGKVKSIGNYQFNYYDFLEEEGKAGKISNIGSVKIDYFYGLENSGKISRIGNLRINYNTDFNENINSGKILGITGSQDGVIIKTALFVQKR